MAGTFRILRIRFLAGGSPSSAPLSIAPSTVVVFVGPNNCGKSVALRELEIECGAGTGVSPNKLIDSVDIDLPTDPAETRASLADLRIPSNLDLLPGPGRMMVEPVVAAADAEVVDSGYLQNAVNWLRDAHTLRLDGRTRFSLVEPKPAGDLRKAAENHLSQLFRDDLARAEVRKLTEDAFGLYFVIDATRMTEFRIRMSPRAPSCTSEERGLDDAAVAFHSQAAEIGEFGDGVQAFVGLMSTVFTTRQKILLIDEPDAFLHPPLARQVGGNLARIATNRSATLIAATHSSEFLMGCLEAVASTTVVRLTFEGGTATARALESAQLAEMGRDPLMRSTDVLSALFHRAAIVTEADADRAFYGEINRRMVREGRGVRDTILLNAQNKQTIHRLVGPLRRIGLPAAAIVDLDFLEDSGTNWYALLDACQVPAQDRSNLTSERSALVTAFAGTQAPPGKDKAIKSVGIGALVAPDQARARHLLEELAKYGLFVVPVGELENWLGHLGIRGRKADWLVNVFSRIGQSETDQNYLRPGSDDIWAFLEAIAAWVNNPLRTGTD